MPEAELSKLILNKLMFAESLKYSELQKGIDNHDLFNYHLKKLLEWRYITKQGSSYSLSADGRKYVSFMEEDGKIQKQFKVGIFMDLIREHNGQFQMLLQKRLKHPHYGYIGTVTGKLQWGQTLEENLKRELMEELQIVPTEYFNIGVVKEIFTNEENEKVADCIFFVYIVTKWEGNIVYKNVEGECFWYDIDKILELDKIFRSAFEQGLPRIKKYLENPSKFSRYIAENGTDGLKY